MIGRIAASILVGVVVFILAAILLGTLAPQFAGLAFIIGVLAGIAWFFGYPGYHRPL